MRATAQNLKLVFFLALLVLVVHNTASAISPESIFMDIIPELPGPYEETTISLRSFSANLDIVSISWLVNGKTVLSGIGKKSFTITAGASGSSITVTANIFLPDGQITKTVAIRPSTTALLWQANDSYVPPFYRGKAIPTLGSAIKVVAMPENTGVAQKNMSYTWKKDYSPDVEASGYGKNYYIYTHDFFDNANTISVETLSVDQKFASGASVMVRPGDPEIIFYRDDQELGIMWESALANYHYLTGPTVVFAAPYFISPKDIRRPELTWEWFINDQPISAPTIIGNVMPLQVEAGSSGVSRLRLEVENIAKFLQTARKEINLQF